MLFSPSKRYLLTGWVVSFVHHLELQSSSAFPVLRNQFCPACILVLPKPLLLSGQKSPWPCALSCVRRGWGILYCNGLKFKSHVLLSLTLTVSSKECAKLRRNGCPVIFFVWRWYKNCFVSCFYISNSDLVYPVCFFFTEELIVLWQCK